MNKLTSNKAVEHWNHIAPMVFQTQYTKEIEELKSRFCEPQHLGKGNTALLYLMKSHQLTPSDLGEIASPEIIKEIISGERALNLRQISVLAKRFGVIPATFMD